MLRELTEYYRPVDLDDALRTLNKLGVVVPLAGGTELLARSDGGVTAVVDLQALGLDYVRRDADGVHIGAMTRLQALVDDPAARAVLDKVVSECVLHSAAHTERVAATVGGTVAAASPWHDLLPALLVLDAVVVLRSLSSEARLPLAEILSSRDKFLQRGTLITEVLIPPQPDHARYTYHRVGRTPADRAIVGVALRFAAGDGAWRQVRIAAGGAATFAMRLVDAEAILDGKQFDHAEAIESAIRAAESAVNPPSDHVSSGEYRRHMIAVLLRRGLREAQLSPAVT